MREDLTFQQPSADYPTEQYFQRKKNILNVWASPVPYVLELIPLTK
ncbi:MAG: hypothetical protein HC912_08965 [Saprospiraceae bacterium]|nr:hypothetical protein [Saprospiraceae bacterium]